MTAFRHFVASAFGQIASAVPGNHRANLDAVFLELCGIGDDVFGDIVGWHRLLRYGTCNGPRQAMIGCAGCTGARSQSDAAISRAAASVVMGRFANPGLSVV